MKIELTKTNVLPLTEGEHFDTEVPRLVLRVRGTSRRYVLRYESKGETDRPRPLGEVGMVTLKAAGEHARALLSGIWKDIDPREAMRREATAGLTRSQMIARTRRIRRGVRSHPRPGPASHVCPRCAGMGGSWPRRLGDDFPENSEFDT